MTYSHQDIEKKWQDKWQKQKIFHCKLDKDRPKFYALTMFPYPSGEGLHVGHLAPCTPMDVVARYKRARGFNVLHPMGYDAFGLPAEQYAIQTGIHPEKVTKKAIDNFRRQLKSFGYSFDWAREVSTCDSSYYKWTQYIFKILFKKKLAYQKEVPVNWCPALLTVLANEEVVDGKSERGGHEVLRKSMKQWMLKITDYAERLLKDLEEVDWPERTKQAQIHWIGKSVGALIRFQFVSNPHYVQVFTTRADTLFGVTYLVLAPEHPLLLEITTSKQKQEVLTYKQKCLRKSEVDRKINQHKTGVFTGAYVTHPITGQSLPVWVSDYVFMDYGTGSVMAVPAHDERDFEFATHFNLPIQKVIECTKLPYVGDGLHIHSSYKEINLNGLKIQEATNRIMIYLTKKKLAQKKIQYKLRDWLFSRQRYWGEPFPIVHTSKGPIVVSDKELPVRLPSTVDYKPTTKGEAPLARILDFVNYKNSQGQIGKRETDTMPGSAASSWYFLRYLDPHNTNQAFDFESQKYWMPVDLYIGGAEHSVGHLLYARFWHKVLYDEGMVSCKEPFNKLVHQGVILGEDGYRMSKSRGNGINPDHIRDEYGADAVRVYICFLGPFEKDKPWSSKGISGSRRFLEKVWKLAQNSKDQNDSLSENLEKALHRTIQKVTNDIETLNFNTAISALMILANQIYKENVKNTKLMQIFCQLLMPFAPHLAEEMWQYLGGKEFISLMKWPEYVESKTVFKEQAIGVQVNGKLRGSLILSLETSKEEACTKALALLGVQKAIANKKIKKCIYKSGKIINLIV